MELSGGSQVNSFDKILFPAQEIQPNWLHILHNESHG